MLLVSGVLENAARVAPDAIAATLDDRSLTFGEVDVQANRIANSLAGGATGGGAIGRGDRGLWWGETTLDAIPVFAALAKIGAVFAPLNARSSLAEVTPVAEYARPRLLLAGASHVEPAAELARSLGVPFGERLHRGAGDAATRRPPGAGPEGPRARARRSWLRPVDPRGSRHRHVGDSARAARCDQGRLAQHRDARVLRVDRSGADTRARRCGPRPQARQRGRRAAGCGGAARR